MHITKIAATALKGRTFTHELSPLVLITGPNFSGKTAITDAVVFALMGHIPDQGKTAQASMELASGARMTVEAAFDTGHHILRRFWRDGSANKTDTSSSLDDETLAALSTPLLNAAEYFELSAAERTRYIYARGLAGDAGDPKKIVGEIERLSYPDTTDEIVEARRQCVENVSYEFNSGNEFAKALNDLTAPAAKKGIIPTQIAYFKKRAVETQGTVRILTELKLREEECSAETLGALEAERERIKTAGEQASQAAGRIAQQRMEQNRLASKLAELHRQKQEVDATLARPAESLAPLEQEIERLRAAITELPKEDREAIEKQCDAALSNSIQAKGNLDDAEKAIMRNGLDIEGATNSEPCPHCGAKPNAARQKSILAKLIEAKAGLTERVAATRKAMIEAEDALEASKKALATARQNAARERELAQSLITKEREIMTRRQTAAELVKTRDRLAGEIEEFPATLDTITEEATHEAAQAVETLRAQYREADEKVKAALALQNDLRRAAQAVQEHQQAKACQLVYSDTLEILVNAQKVAIDTLFENLLADANFFTLDILPGPIVFEAGEIGLRHGPIFSKVLSGTEQALVYIAISAALSRRLKFRIAILDELSRADADNKQKIVGRLAEAVEGGLLDQVIIVDPVLECPAVLPCPWTLITLP